MTGTITSDSQWLNTERKTRTLISPGHDGEELKNEQGKGLPDSFNAIGCILKMDDTNRN
jgi:hypothetical protein